MRALHPTRSHADAVARVDDRCFDGFAEICGGETPRRVNAAIDGMPPSRTRARRALGTDGHGRRDTSGRAALAGDFADDLELAPEPAYGHRKTVGGEPRLVRIGHESAPERIFRVEPVDQRDEARPGRVRQVYKFDRHYEVLRLLRSPPAS